MGLYDIIYYKPFIINGTNGTLYKAKVVKSKGDKLLKGTIYNRLI